MFRTRSRSRVAALVLFAVAAMALAGCQPIVATRTSGPVADTATPTESAPATDEPSASSGQGGVGSITVSITEPVQVSGDADVSVICTSRARTYTAQAQSVVVNGYQVSFTVRVAAYNGTGTYQSLVTMRLDGASGTVTTVTGLPKVPATVTDSGGSYQINATGQNGRSLVATISWTCS